MPKPRRKVAQSRQAVEILRTLLEQHWLECKHIESERAWFMNAYAVVIGGASAFIIGMGVEDLATLESSLTFKFLVAFLIGFTFFGFFHTLRWTYAFECHRNRVNELAKVLWSMGRVDVPLEPGMKIEAMNILPESICMEKIPERLRSIVNEIFRTRYWFPLFYFVILVGLVVLSLIVSFPAWGKGIIITTLVAAFLLGVRWYFSLKKVK